MSNESWTHQPLTLDLSAKALGTLRTDEKELAKLQAVGLEPSKAEYKETLGSLPGKSGEVRHPNWVARVFGAKNRPASTLEGPQLRPCVGKECKPVPVPPKPCVGAKCPKPPTPTPQSGVCLNGYDANGYCAPWGYVEQGHVHLCRINSDYCWRILEEIGRERQIRQDLDSEQQRICSGAPQSGECAQAVINLQNSVDRINQLEDQYRMCRMAAQLP
jgi:hypothetical protein